MPKRPAVSTTGPRPLAETPAPPAAGPDVLDEHGAFAFARCDVCGWRSPGRRSRDRARTDLKRHLDAESNHGAADSGALP